MSKFHQQPADEKYNLNNYVSPYLWYDPSPYRDAVVANQALAATQTLFINNKITAYPDLTLSDTGPTGKDTLFGPKQANGVCTTYYVKGTGMVCLTPPTSGFSGSFYSLGFVMAACFSWGDSDVAQDLRCFEMTTGLSSIWVGASALTTVTGAGVVDDFGSAITISDGPDVEVSADGSSGSGRVTCVMFRKIKNSNTLQIGVNNLPMKTFSDAHYIRGVKNITYREITIRNDIYQCVGECFVLLDEQPDGVFKDLREYYVKKWRGKKTDFDKQVKPALQTVKESEALSSWIGKKASTKREFQVRQSTKVNKIRKKGYTG
jgi:hypothetical protein